MMSPVDADQYAARLKALADPNRLILISIIRAAGDAGIRLMKLKDANGGLTQATVSHHMRVLVRAGFVRRRRRWDPRPEVVFVVDVEAVAVFMDGLRDVVWR